MTSPAQDLLGLRTISSFEIMQERLKFSLKTSPCRIHRITHNASDDIQASTERSVYEYSKLGGYERRLGHPVEDVDVIISPSLHMADELIDNPQCCQPNISGHSLDVFWANACHLLGSNTAND